MASSFGNALIGGLIGAVATALVAAGTGLFSKVTEATLDQAADTLLSRLEVRLEKGESTTKSPANFYATCDVGQMIVGGTCIIETGDGYLQNQGVVDQNENHMSQTQGRLVGNRYACTYSARANPGGVNASAWAACLKRK